MDDTTRSNYTENNISAFPRTMTDFENDVDRMFPSNTGAYESNSKNTNVVPDTILAGAHDIGNYIAKYGMANFQIQIIMSINGNLDFGKLVKAVRLTADAEPVFGCRFIKGDPPYWKRFEDIDAAEKFCSIEEHDNPEEGIQAFLKSKMSMDKDPMVLVKVIRSGSYDTLCIKINHVCTDGSGARDYILLLSDIYTCLDKGEADYLPNPSTRDNKDIGELKNALTADKPESSWGLQQQFASPTWNFPWKGWRTGSTDFSVCKLPYGQLDIMSSYSKARGATINDLILTSVFRAMFKLTKPIYGVPMDIPLTIDLRRYLQNHKAGAIRNLSGGFVVRLDRRHHEPFEGTLSRVNAFTKEMRDKHPSVLNSLWCEQIERMSFHHICAYYKYMSQLIDFASQSPVNILNNCSPVLSNCGFISKSLIKFGEYTVVDAYIIPPVVRAPGILLVASTYNDILTLGVGYYESSVEKSVMDSLLNRIKDELVEGCKN